MCERETKRKFTNEFIKFMESQGIKFVDVESGEEIEPTEDEVSLTVQRIKAHNTLRNMTISEEKSKLVKEIKKVKS